VNTNSPDMVETTAQWIEEAGYKGDLSVVTAGLHDIHASIAKVYSDLLLSLLKLEKSEKEAALGIVVDLLVEFEHIRDHAEVAASSLIEIRDFFDTSPISNSTRSTP
jgi:hypothetical protein